MDDSKQEVLQRIQEKFSKRVYTNNISAETLKQIILSEDKEFVSLIKERQLGNKILRISGQDLRSMTKKPHIDPGKKYTLIQQIRMPEECTISNIDLTSIYDVLFLECQIETIIFENCFIEKESDLNKYSVIASDSQINELTIINSKIDIIRLQSECLFESIKIIDNSRISSLQVSNSILEGFLVEGGSSISILNMFASSLMMVMIAADNAHVEVINVGKNGIIESIEAQTNSLVSYVKIQWGGRVGFIDFTNCAVKDISATGAHLESLSISNKSSIRAIKLDQVSNLKKLYIEESCQTGELKIAQTDILDINIRASLLAEIMFVESICKSLQVNESQMGLEMSMSSIEKIELTECNITKFKTTPMPNTSTVLSECDIHILEIKNSNLDKDSSLNIINCRVGALKIINMNILGSLWLRKISPLRNDKLWINKYTTYSAAEKNTRYNPEKKIPSLPTDPRNTNNTLFAG